MRLEILALAALLALPAAGWAADTPLLDRQQQQQRQRIHQGVNSGELTRPETRQLVRQQKRLHQHEAQAKSDGVVTTQERKRLRDHAQQSSRNIYRQKHDSQRRR